MNTIYPNCTAAAALEIFRDPSHRLFVQFGVVKEGHRLTFMIRNADYTLLLTRGTKEDLRSAVAGVLNWVVCWAARAASIDNASQLRWMAEIVAEVDTTGRYGDGSK